MESINLILADSTPSNLAIFPSSLVVMVSWLGQSVSVCAASSQPLAVQGHPSTTASRRIGSIYRWDTFGGWDSDSVVWH